MIGGEVLFNSKFNLYNYMYNIIPNLFGRKNIVYSFRDTDSITYKIKNCSYEEYLNILKENPHLFGKMIGLMENEIDKNINKVISLRSKCHSIQKISDINVDNNNLRKSQGISKYYSKKYHTHYYFQKILFNEFYSLKNKNSNEIINCFKDIFKKSKGRPNFIQSDEGSEFTNKIVQNFFNDNNIKWYHTFNRDIKCSLCERFNRTILNKIYKNFTLNNNTIWIKDLNKLVKEYNNSYHTTIKMKPVDASNKSNENIVRKNYNFEITNKKSKFSIGDKVRISLLKNNFEKGYTSNWSEQIYVIDDIKSSNVHYYFLKDLNGEKLDGSFY